MKEAEKIINGIKYWLNEDQKNRTAVVILADNKEGGVWGFSKGKTHKIGHFIYSLMTENKELGHDIYAAACLYAQSHITAGERDKINAVMSTVDKERKKIEAFISAVDEECKKIEAFISATAEARKKPKGGER